jgi:hypothetical protein
VDPSLQFAQVDKKFEPRIVKLFKQAGYSVKLDIREVILLDSQSNVDLFCNAALVSKPSKSKSSMRLKINGGTMVVNLKSPMPGYTKTDWCSTRAITNIIALRNLIDQYRVTYDSDDLMLWNYECMRAVCIITTPGSNITLFSLTMSRRTRQDLLSSKSRVHNSHELCPRLDLPVHEGLQVDDSQKPN